MISSVYPTQKPSVYAKRRASLAAAIRKQGRGVVLIRSGEEVMRNRDSDYPFRSDSYFYYLTGFPEAEACLALVVGAESTRSILLCREKNLEREIWDGFRFGPEFARKHFGFQEAHPVDDMEEVLENLLANQKAVYLKLGEDPELEGAV